MERTPHNPIPHTDADNDDLPVGRVLTRREVLALLGVTGASLLAACTVPAVAPAATATATQPSAEAATAVAITADPTAQAAAAAEVAAVEAANAAGVPSCVVRPEMTEGPYFVDAMLNRADIRTEPSDGSVVAGTPLELIFRVSQVSADGCSALAGATVDVWHCDATGVYSGVRDPRFDTSQMSFLRGYQETGADGFARFMTIYPGWYSGRAVHIHFKIRTTAAAGSTYDFTSQLFFDEAVNAQVYSQPPYAEKGLADVPNASDGIFRNGGTQLLLTPTATADGYSATFDIGLDLSA
jgi:protocatechuate 3,4-dioxygenase beta subunit